MKVKTTLSTDPDIPSGAKQRRMNMSSMFTGFMREQFDLYDKMNSQIAKRRRF